MRIKQTLLLSSLSMLLLSGACTAASNSDSDRQDPEVEMVDVTIRMPDGRVIVRKEPRTPSRINERLKKKMHGSDSQGGQVVVLGSGVSGGSNSSSGHAGSGGAGGSSSQSRGGGGGGVVSSEETGDEGIQSVQPDTDYTVRLYAWENSGARFEHVMRTYIADPRGVSAARLAEKIAAEVEEEQPERVAIRFWKEFKPARRDPFDHSNPRELLTSGGYTSGLTEYWNTFARELAARGVRPDYLIHDMEEGIDFWEIEERDRRGFFDQIMESESFSHPALPDSMESVSVAQFMNYRHARGTIALNDYSDFAGEFRAALLRNVFSAAFDAAYGEHIPISNYTDFNATFAVTHYTNRPLHGGTVGGISAPYTYLDYREERSAPRYRRMQKDQRWNRLIDALNRCRSAAGAGLVTPWVSAPGYGRYGAHTWARASDLQSEYRVWEIHMSHMLAMGIDTFILWNPGTRFNPNAPATDAFIDQWLGQHPMVGGPQLGDLPEIQLDADMIMTNGIVTTYAEFMDAMSNQ